MIIEGEWRETSLAFIDFIKINYNEDRACGRKVGLCNA